MALLFQNAPFTPLAAHPGTSARPARSISVESLFAGGLASAVLVFTAWAWGGLMPAAYAVTLVLSGWLLLFLLAATLRARHTFLGRDPLFATGLLFLAYLSLQWWNSGRSLYFDAGWECWMHTPPPYPGFPSGFARAETAEMLAWFFPPWVLALALRSSLIQVQTLTAVLRITVWAGGLLALLGILQFAAGSKAPYSAGSFACPFFASFGYANHAAAFFLMVAALAAGLLYRETVRREHPVSRPLAASLGLAMVLCLAGVNLSLSRAGVILSWLFAFFAVGFALWRGWPVLSKARRVKYSAATAGILAALALGVAGMADSAILSEFKTNPSDGAGEATVNFSMGGRAKLRELGWQVWKEAPWGGVGGWGFRHRAAFHLAPAEWTLLERKGWANVHCDPLQFAAEFGVVGSGLGLVALACLLGPALRALRSGGNLLILAGSGLVLVAGLSLIDIPFRCPAILITWTGILAILPRAAAPFRGEAYPALQVQLPKEIS